MGKKRKSRGPQEPKGPRGVDPADARLGPVTTYADIADSEDEYFMKQDEIRFDDEPNSKRQRKLDEEAAFLSESEDEVLAINDSDDSDADLIAAQKASKSQRRRDSNWWGSSRKEYYDADQIETEADALEEEAEAKRLQQKKLAKMTDEDFFFDQDEWLQEDGKEDGPEVVTEVLADIEIADDMTPDDRYSLLKARYPEFEPLVAEFQELHPQLPVLQQEAEGRPSRSLPAVKYWILGCYVAALASYFALLTSPARDEAGVQKTMNPAELRDHDIMETLVACREQWNRVKSLKASLLDVAAETSEAESGADDARDESMLDDAALTKPKAQKKKKTKPTKKDLEASRAAQKAGKVAEAAAAAEDDFSDFGEEDSLDAKAAAEKAQRKKSLRFYTSQIVQKANKRAGAGRDAGGDMDIPYRERLRDRQARLNAEAERRGKKGLKPGEALGGDDSDGEGDAGAKAMRDNEDEYYDMVAAISNKKKTEKADRKAALAAASATDRVVEVEEIGEDGKRKVTYAIEKNKGLTPRRKKENRNPRVKKRMAYEAKMKKLKSMKPTFKPEPKGGYRGVETGIKAGLIKSTKF
ncbi:unnamed protein product [Parascedosporium putredinis]|uniref:Sas10 C-terminal domain-containing protein n=1 Tax=Parascedosporium putredinis TaxID=1442378 RepID=A0A9P1HBU1_9PEZI|nr:unnamed protein product [Parascedosporium putredinis]CAI8003113.1 unnamed protein product [Parascedosporium putredinis]